MSKCQALWIALVLGAIGLASWGCTSRHVPDATATPDVAATPEATATAAVAWRGVNLGNALEAPNEGDWGFVIEDAYFAAIHEGGFDLVRVPIRWSAHAAAEAPYTIEPAFFERIDRIIAQARANDLAIIINVHHYDELFADPDAQRERFIALWRQIATRYQGEDEAVLFEILNEPHDHLQGDAWQALMSETLAVIRETNPERWVVVDGDNWGSVQGLSSLQLPEDDRRLLATFHYYQPFQFTHQGAEWASGSEAWLGATWTGTAAQQAAVRHDLDLAAQWAQQHNRPILLGEFGTYSRADLSSRAAWTAFIAREAEARGFAWAYWEFGAGFGVYDPAAGAYIPALHDALIPANDAQ